MQICRQEQQHELAKSDQAIKNLIALEAAKLEVHEMETKKKSLEETNQALLQFQKAKAATYIHEKAIEKNESYEAIAKNIGHLLAEDYGKFPYEFLPSIVQEATSTVSKDIEKFKQRYSTVAELRAIVNEMGDAANELRDEYMKQANYDIIKGQEINDLTDEKFAHDVDLLWGLIQKRRQSSE